MQESIVIERPGLRDLFELNKLENLCFDLDAWPIIDLIGILTLPGVIRLKAMMDNRMVGFAAAEIRKNIGWILTIGVHPDFRQMGIASRLLDECETSLHTKSVRLTVRESNSKAIALYNKRGYRKVDIWENYYPGNENGIVYEKLIDITLNSS